MKLDEAAVIGLAQKWVYWLDRGESQECEQALENLHNAVHRLNSVQKMEAVHRLNSVQKMEIDGTGT